MADTLNLKIPPTMLRLGVEDVEKLAEIGMSRDVERSDIQRLMDGRYPNRKRAANAMTRLVRQPEIDMFNDDLLNVRERDLKQYDRKSIESSYSRGIVTIRLFKHR